MRPRKVGRRRRTPRLPGEKENGGLDRVAPIEQTSRGRPRSGDGLLLPGVQGDAAEDVVLGDLDGGEGEAAGRLGEQDGARDDGRRARRVEAGDLPALVQRERREHVAELFYSC